MEYEVEGLMRDIRIALDQNMDNTSLSDFNDADTLTLDQIIKSKLEIAVRLVELNAPVQLLSDSRRLQNSISWMGQQVGIGGGSIVLPDDFVRLVVFEMSDWRMPVSNPISDKDPKYAMQRSRFSGIRGNIDRPVVAITTRSVGQVLEFYSCSAGKNVFIKQGRYIPQRKIEHGRIHVSEKLKDAVVHYTASMVASTIGQTELSQQLLAIGKELIKQA